MTNKCSIVSLLVGLFTAAAVHASIENEPPQKLTFLTEVNFGSKHTDKGYRDEAGRGHIYNDEHDLLSVGVRWGEYTLGVSQFKNSYYDSSTMLSLEYTLSMGDLPVDLDLGVGLVDGYKPEIVRQDEYFIGDDYMVAPLAALALRSDYLEFAGVTFSPKVRMMGVTAFMLNLEIGYTVN